MTTSSGQSLSHFPDPSWLQLGKERVSESAAAGASGLAQFPKARPCWGRSLAALKRRGLAVRKIFPRQILPQSVPSRSACFRPHHRCQRLTRALRLLPPGPARLPAFSDPCSKTL